MSQAAYLVRRVLDALLREDYRGIARRGVAEPGPDGAWLTVDVGGRALRLPVEPGRFLADWTVREAAVATPAGRVTGLDEVLELFRPDVDEEGMAGFDGFAEECRQALDALRVGERHRPRVLAALPADRRGPRGSLTYETLAAHLDHPVYPTARCRLGIATEDLPRYAPEFAPAFPLRWVALPREAVTVRGALPAIWPDCARLGLPAALGTTHVPVPVHPLTFGAPLDEALREAGLAGRAVRADGPYLQVSPTLSMRTVAVAADPSLHLKLPLPTSTLGARNRRSIKPGTLTDGAAVQLLLSEALAGGSELAGRVLLADETTYGHAGQEFLAFLVRRYPAGLEDAHVVPVAALLAGDADGRPVIAGLADKFCGGDVAALFDAYLTLLFRLHVRLWLRRGIVLESHQQNTALVLRPDAPMALLLKDNDGARIDPELLGQVPPVDDARMLVRDPHELADLFTTITVHLGAGAPAFGLAERGLLPLATGLRLVRRRLEDALAGLESARDAALLRYRVLGADRLPVKSMVTAGTLLPKARTRAADINKYYGTTGPNYLLIPEEARALHGPRRHSRAGHRPHAAQLPDPGGVRP